MDTLFHFPHLEHYIFISLIVFVTYSAFRLVIDIKKKSIRVDGIFFAVFSFSIFAFTIGLVTGNSLSPVASVVISSLLSFFGGVSIYVFSISKKKDNVEPETRGLGDYSFILTTSILLVVSVFLMYGISIGSRDKARYRNHLRNAELLEYKKKQEVEFQIKLNYERQLREIDSKD